MHERKPCSKCKRPLPPEAYAMTSRNGYRYPRADCKQCQAFRSAGWFQRKKAEQRPIRTAYMRTWRARDREGYNARMRRMRLARVLRRATL